MNIKEKINSFLSNLRAKLQLEDDFNDFINEIYFINISRLTILSVLMIIIFLCLLIVDYNNYKAGRYEISFAYRIIFYAHCSSIINLGIYRLSNINKWNYVGRITRFSVYGVPQIPLI